MYVLLICYKPEVFVKKNKKLIFFLRKNVLLCSEMNEFDQKVQATLTQEEITIRPHSLFSFFTHNFYCFLND